MNRRLAIVGILVTLCLLEGIVSYSFMERHWNQVTRRLSESMARDIAAIVDLYEVSSTKEEVARLVRISLDRFHLSVSELPAGSLPPPQPKPFFDLLDRALSDEIRENIARPFWIDTVGQSRQVEVRIKLDQATLRFVAPRGQVYASNSHIFLSWMVGSWLLVLAVAYLALRPLRPAHGRRP